MDFQEIIVFLQKLPTEHWCHAPPPAPAPMHCGRLRACDYDRGTRYLLEPGFQASEYRTRQSGVLGSKGDQASLTAAGGLVVAAVCRCGAAGDWDARAARVVCPARATGDPSLRVACVQCGRWPARRRGPRPRRGAEVQGRRLHKWRCRRRWGGDVS